MTSGGANIRILLVGIGNMETRNSPQEHGERDKAHVKIEAAYMKTGGFFLHTGITGLAPCPYEDGVACSGRQRLLRGGCGVDVYQNTNYITLTVLRHTTIPPGQTCASTCQGPTELPKVAIPAPH